MAEYKEVQKKIVDNSAARAAQQKQNEKDRLRAAAVTLDVQAQLEESYRLAKLRATADAELRAKPGSAGGGASSTPTGGGKGGK